MDGTSNKRGLSGRQAIGLGRVLQSSSLTAGDVGCQYPKAAPRPSLGRSLFYLDLVTVSQRQGGK